jgi:hypothetical protein
MRPVTPLALALVAGLAPPALAQTLEIIYSGVPGAPAAKRAVPGIPGRNFTSGTSVAFARMFASPNGQHWAVTALIDTGVTTTDQIVMLVSGSSAQVVAHEGDATPFDPARHWGAFDDDLGLNDSGTLAFVNNLADGATTDDELIAKYTLVAGVSTFDSTPYREGVAAADAGVTTFIPAGAAYGINISTPVVLSNGDICALVQLNALTGQIDSTNDETVYRAGVAQHRELFTNPPGWPNLWDSWTAGNALYSADGSHQILDGDDNSSFDDITTVDGVVKVQQAQIIPGLTTATDTGATDFVWMTPSGDWFARGNNTNVDEDWVVRNGVVIANALGGATQDITPANPSGELWSDTDFANCFFVCTGNSVGDYVLAGVTNAAANRNAVLVLNGTTVLAREDDPVDLDGNGLPDDNVYIRTFGDDTAFLTDDGWLYVRITLTSDPVLGGTGPNLGYSIVRLRAFTPSGCYANCDGSTTAPVLNVADFTCFLQKYAGGDGYANCDGSTTAPTLNVADFTCFLQKYAAGCP